MTAQPLTDRPDIAANILNLAEQTGIPVDRWITWLASDPPPGITRLDWLDALASTSGAPPLPRTAKERLRHIVAPTRQANAA